MSNIFSRMSQKEKQDFNNLDSNKKSELIQTAFIEKISPVMANQIAKAMISGSNQEDERLYKKYVEKMDLFCSHGDENWMDLVNQLLSYLRMAHLEYEKNKIKNQGG